MKVSQYEGLYVCAQNAVDITKYMDNIVDFLKQQKTPVTCSEVGVAIFGEKYNSKKWKRSCASILGHALSHLKTAGLIKVEKIDGQPVKVPFEEIVYTNSEGEANKIKVWDKDGNEYLIHNPKFNTPIRQCKNNYNWVTVEKTIIPEISTYLWVAD